MISISDLGCRSPGQLPPYRVNSHQCHPEQSEKCSWAWYRCPKLSLRAQAFPSVLAAIPHVLAFSLTVILRSPRGCQMMEGCIVTPQKSGSTRRRKRHDRRNASLPVLSQVTRPLPVSRLSSPLLVRQVPGTVAPAPSPPGWRHAQPTFSLLEIYICSWFNMLANSSVFPLGARYVHSLLGCGSVHFIVLHTEWPLILKFSVSYLRKSNLCFKWKLLLYKWLWKHATGMFSDCIGLGNENNRLKTDIKK